MCDMRHGLYLRCRGGDVVAATRRLVVYANCVGDALDTAARRQNAAAPQQVCHCVAADCEVTHLALGDPMDVARAVRCLWAMAST